MSTFSDKSNYKSDKNDDKKTLIEIPKFRYKDNFIKGHFLQKVTYKHIPIYNFVPCLKYQEHLFVFQCKVIL